MFKFVVALAFIAACSATYDLGLSKTYTVDLGKDYIKVADQYGKYVNFKVEQYYGYEAPQYIFIELYGKQEEPKVVKYFDEKEIEGKYQNQILYRIFSQYQGEIDSIQYEKILALIREYVQQGQIHPTILYSLKALYGDYEALSYLEYYTKYNKPEGQYGDIYRQYFKKEFTKQTPYKKFYFGKSFGYGDSQNRDYESYYPSQYGKGIYQQYSGPYDTEYQYNKESQYQQTPYKGLDILFGKRFGYEKLYNQRERSYDRDYKSFYPSKYGYEQQYYGPYNRQYQGQYAYEQQQKFHQYPKYQEQYGYQQKYYSYPKYQEQYGYEQKYNQYPKYQEQYGYEQKYHQYPKYEQQYGKSYGVEYPEQYQKSYTQEYYGPYASQYRGYGDSLGYRNLYQNQYQQYQSKYQL